MVENRILAGKPFQDKFGNHLFIKQSQVTTYIYEKSSYYIYAWVRSLFHRAVNICSNLTFLNYKQISMISKFMSWNGFPANVRFSITRKLKTKYQVNSSKDSSNHNTNEVSTQNDFSDDARPKIWIRIPFLGKEGEYLVKNLLKKIQRNLTQPVKFVVIYDTKKVSYFLPKTKLLALQYCLRTYLWLLDCRNIQIL